MTAIAIISTEDVSRLVWLLNRCTGWQMKRVDNKEILSQTWDCPIYSDEASGAILWANITYSGLRNKKYKEADYFLYPGNGSVTACLPLIKSISEVQMAVIVNDLLPLPIVAELR